MDYEILNEVIVLASYVIPFMDKLIYSHGDYNVYAGLDAKCG